VFFVERPGLVDELSAAPESGRARVANAFGIAGTGKSWLIGRAKGLWRSRDEAIVFELDLPGSAPTTPSQAYDAFIECVGLLAAELAQTSGRERTLGDFDNELRAIGLKPLVDIHQTVNAEGAHVASQAEVGVLDVDVDADAIQAGYGPKSWAVTSLFVQSFRSTLKRKTLVVSVGEYDAVAGSVLVHWLLRLLASLPNTLVLIERSPGTAKLPVAADEQVVPLFTRDEVGTLLANCLETKPDPVLVDTVYEWSGGHPATAALAGRFLRTLDSSRAEDFVARLRSLPEDLAAERARIALELSGSGEPPLLRTAAIARRFDEELLAALLDDPPPDDAIERLRDMQVVEAVGNPDSGTFRVYRYLRDPLLGLLTPRRRKVLHGRAAAYYYDALCREEPELDENALSYEAWYRYEKPEWQETLREWLYHLGEGARTDRERQKARLEFTRIFLDAFWWWGCYVDFPFCHNLLADWERARGDDADWVQDLRLLLDAYPTGWRKAGEGNWLDVEAALVEIKQSCGIAAEAAKLKGSDARHTRGLVDNFVAHSFRYRTYADDAARERQYQRAVGYYDQTAKLFAKESWELAWTLFETAELHSDFGQFDAARETWRRAVALALDEDDQELNANLHRLRADIRWQAGAKADAFDSHGRALLHAYLFQCKTPSHRPDAYTLAFYLEHVERVHERLRTLPEAELPDAIARVRSPFLIDGAAGEAASVPDDHRELAGTILPAGPGPEELNATRSQLTRRIDILAEELGDSVGRDLDGVEP
jgi:tetratricopeptide (TPR) repeat protein